MRNPEEEDPNLPDYEQPTNFERHWVRLSPRVTVKDHNSGMGPRGLLTQPFKQEFLDQMEVLDLWAPGDEHAEQSMAVTTYVSPPVPQQQVVELAGDDDDEDTPRPLEQHTESDYGSED